MPKFNEKQFEAEQDLRTLIDAKKIEKDSKRKKAALAEGRKQKAALSAIAK